MAAPAAATYQNVFLNGLGASGSASFGPSAIEFRDESNALKQSVAGEQMLKTFVVTYGSNGQLQVVMKDGKTVLLYGFSKEELGKVKEYVEKQYGVTCEKAEVSDGV